MKLADVDLLHSAVIVIDVQNDYCHENGGIAKAGRDVAPVQRMVPNLMAFLPQARQLKVPIIHVRTEHGEWTNSPSWVKRFPGASRGLLKPGSWGAEFYMVLPEPGDCIVTKHRYTAFLDTDLDVTLRSQGIRTVVLAGCATSICVESTARDAFNRDYYVVVLNDCVAAYSMQMHQASLAVLGEFFGAVVNSQELVEAWRSGGPLLGQKGG